ncbi:hypothetical protein D3C71_1295720 [compost metagenome]
MLGARIDGNHISQATGVNIIGLILVHFGSWCRCHLERPGKFSYIIRRAEDLVRGEQHCGFSFHEHLVQGRLRSDLLRMRHQALIGEHHVRIDLKRLDR